MFHPLPLKVTDRSIDSDPKAAADLCQHSFRGSRHHDRFSALQPYLLESLLVI